MVVPELGIQDKSSSLRYSDAVAKVAYGLLREAAQEQGLVPQGVMPAIERLALKIFLLSMDGNRWNALLL